MKKQLKKLQEMKQKKELGNKGFSLIELIIVIAIMAILMALIGLQVLPMVEKSKVNSDYQTLDSCLTALQTSVAERTVGDFSGKKMSAISDTAVKEELERLIGLSETDLQKKFQSGDAKGKDVLFTYTAPTATNKAGVFKVEAGTLWVSNNGSSKDATSSSGGTTD